LIQKEEIMVSKFILLHIVTILFALTGYIVLPKDIFSFYLLVIGIIYAGCVPVIFIQDMIERRK